jgi:hypothetical protein
VTDDCAVPIKIGAGIVKVAHWAITRPGVFNEAVSAGANRSAFTNMERR